MLIEYLPWDSDFFGFAIGRYLKNTLDAAGELAFFDEFARGKFDCVYVFADSLDKKTKEMAEHNKFLFIDERQIYYLSDDYLIEMILRKNSYQVLDRSNEQAIARVRGIVDEISSVSRFVHDPRLRDKAKSMYAIWFDQIMSGQSSDFIVISEKQNGLPVAVVGCSVNNNIGELVLVGVDSRFRDQGLGIVVVQSAIGWLYEHGAKCIMVKTQTSAKKALRLYEKAGFVLNETQSIYHVWRKL